MKLIYISGPYRASTVAGIRDNIRKAEVVRDRLMQLGYAVICPHANTAFSDGVVPDEHFLDMDLEILKRCDLIYMMRGWEKSVGATAELDLARTNGLPTIYEGAE